MSLGVASILCSTSGYAQVSFADLDAEFSGMAGDEGSSVHGPILEKFRGYLAEELRVYPLDRGQGNNDQQLITEAELEINIRLVGGLALEAMPWFMIDALDTNLLRYEPRSAYLIYRGEFYDLLAGQFIESWGITDTFNPLDVLNRRDLGVDAVGAPPRGELGARVRWTLPGGDILGEPSFGVYALPLWRETEFPTERQRFSFSTPTTQLLQEGVSGPDGIDRLFAALRFDSTLSTQWVSADVQILAARGPGRTPLFGVQMSPSGVAALIPQYYGEWTLGGGFHAVPEADGWSKFTLKGEFAYKRPYVFSNFSGMHLADLMQKPDDYVQFVTGFDRSISHFLSTQDELTLTLEYAGEAGAGDAATFLRPFDSDLALRVHWSVGDFARSSLEARAVVDVTNGEVIAEAIAARQLRFIHEDLKGEISGRWLRASMSQGSLLSAFPTNNSSVKARLQFDF